MAQVNAGRVRFVSRGEYNNATQYYTFDLINYNGSSYYAKQNTLGNLPTNATYWQIVAEQGNGISSITKTSTSGLVDTYTITYTNGSTTTFDVTNGEDGFSPIANVTQTETGAIISITDENGTTTANIKNGEVTQEQLDYYKTILNALPKVEGTGTSITLNDTANAPMELKLKPSQLEQETTTGKNLFNKDTTTDGYYYNPSGEYVATGYDAYVSDYIEVNANENYTLQTNNAGSSTRRINYFDSNKVWLSQVYTNNSNYTFTIPTNAKYIRASFFQINKENIQIEKGSTVTELEPYTGGNPSPNPDYPQDVHIITGDNQITILNNDETKTQICLLSLGDLEYGKIGNHEDEFYKADNETNNLFDGEIELGSINANTGDLVSNNSRTRSKNFIKVKPNTTYTYSHTVGERRWIIGYTENKEGITDGIAGAASAIASSDIRVPIIHFTTTATTEYIKWYDTNSTDLEEQVMLNEGTAVLPYEPYNNGKWYLKKYIFKVVLNGSEDITLNNQGQSAQYYKIILNNKAFVNNDVILPNLSTHFISTKNSWAVYNEGKFCISGSGDLILCSTTINTLQDMKTWLSQNNPEFEYQLATPKYILLNDTLQEQLNKIRDWLLSYQDQTNITQENNDLPFVIEASAVYDMNKLVSRVANLES